MSPARDAILNATRAFVGLAAHSVAEVTEDVSLTQYRVLVLLDAHGPQAMGRLATSLGVQPSTLTRICDVLVHKGLIRRQPVPDNRRTIHAELTAGGRKLVRQVTAQRGRIIDAVLARMAPEAQDRIAQSLGEFTAAAGDLPDVAWTLGWSVES